VELVWVIEERKVKNNSVEFVFNNWKDRIGIYLFLWY
jgi:hypothetical protein